MFSRVGEGAASPAERPFFMSPIPATDPQHVREAPSHSDPYPYYSRLARGAPIFRDEANGWWVAANSAAVNEVLTNDLCLTRPPGDPVPAAVRAGPMVEIFGRLVRLRDDEARRPLKSAVELALRNLPQGQVADLVRARAAELNGELGLPLDPSKITQFMYALPVQTIACLLGIPSRKFSDAMSWLGDYGVATAAAATGFPAPDAGLLDRGHRAAQALLDMVGTLKDDSDTRGPLLDALVLEAGRAGCDEKDIVANAVGYMLQGYAATASLIGLTLLALARQPELLAQVKSDRKLLGQIILEVVRCDPTTNSTLRFMARDGVVAGQAMQRGDLIIVLIAAANRDPALNRHPDQFDVMRPDRKYLEFGAGPHACPADKFATLVALIAVDHLLTLEIPFDRLEDSLSYAVSGHIRTPLFKS